jgi:hypothetical protein
VRCRDGRSGHVSGVAHRRYQRRHVEASSTLRQSSAVGTRSSALLATAGLLLTIALLAGRPSMASLAKYDDVKRLQVALTWANIRGQYGKVWPPLHPRYQRVTTRAFWEECHRKDARKAAGVEWLSIRATDAYDDKRTFPLLGRVSVVAVSMEAKIDYLGLKRTIRDTLYWMKVADNWRGLWEPEMYRAYRAHRCPT